MKKIFWKIRFWKINSKSILGKLTITFSLLVMISLIVTGVSTYLITKASVTKEFKNSSIETLKQNKNYVEMINSSVDNMPAQLYSNKKFVSLINNDKVDNDALDNNRVLISNELTNATLTNSLNVISGMTFYSENGLTSSFPTNVRTLEESNSVMEGAKKESWYNVVVKNNGKPYWLPPHDSKIVEGRNASYLSSISVIKNITGTKVLGILEIDISVDVLNSALTDSKIGKNGYIYYR